MPGAVGEMVVVCVSCGSSVVGPQPEFGCQAMLYRDWLRLQEIDWHAAGEEGFGLAGSGCDEARGWAKVLTTVRSPGISRSRMRRVALAAVLATAAGGVLTMGWQGRDASKSSPTPIEPTAVATVAPPVPTAFAPLSLSNALPVSTSAVAAPPPHPHGAPLAALLRGEMPADAAVVVHATRTRSFARSAPSDDAFLCLKLVDANDATVQTRAYAPLRSDSATGITSFLPWGRTRPVSIQLRWHPPAQEIEGHWQIVTITPEPS